MKENILPMLFSVISSAIRKSGFVVEAMEPEAVAKTRDANPLVGIALKEDLRGDDRDVLNIKPIDIVKNNKYPDNGKVLLTDIAQKIENKESKSDIFQMKDQKVKKKKNKIGLIILPIILLLGFLVFKFFPYLNSIRNQGEGVIQEEKNGEVLVEPTMESVQVEQKIEEKSYYKILILNGSGKTGEADVVSRLFGEEGFTDIETRNADNFDNLNTKVSIKDSFPQQYLDQIIQILDVLFDVSSNTGSLGEENRFDVEIIIGKRR
jgi:hypothetical protein